MKTGDMLCFSHAGGNLQPGRAVDHMCADFLLCYCSICSQHLMFKLTCYYMSKHYIKQPVKPKIWRIEYCKSKMQAHTSPGS
uniref:Uncharacterized protein n=1 Tax=Anguilla anguilla TaxID=7936 RepID=A0A0E9WTJ8_ANGAN